ncbi:MAG: NAD(P)H-hydrate epimerase [Clostridiales bacterium]|nr:NAD(P)H-hydrate epimerase [Clostridiales bacterium]
MDERIVTGEEMKRLDRQTIEGHGVPSLVLMERAALAAVDVLLSGGFDLERVTVICGPGNNGGDGIAVARLLHLAGRNVTLIFVGDPEKRSEETRRQQGIAGSYGLPVGALAQAMNRAEGPTTLVDAIFGIGGVRAPAGNFLEAVRYINATRATGAKVLAIDIPSGVCADTGGVPGEAVSADATVTFAYKKAGLASPPGNSFAGEVFVKDIGIYA